MFEYVLIVTEEKNENVEFYANRPDEGLLRDIVFGSNAEMLMKGENEGMFYQLYDMRSGEKIGYGILDLLSIRDDISFNQNNNM